MKPIPKFAIASLLAIAPFLAGCSALVSRDVNAALSVAARTNVANWRTATLEVAARHDNQSEKLEASLDQKILVAKDGPAALRLVRDYRAKRAEFAKAKALHLAIYAKANDNAAVMDGLIDQMIRIDARFDALVGRFKPIAHIRAIAEVESKAFINAISQPSAP